MKGPNKIVSTVETTKLRERYNLYLDEKLKLLEKVEDAERAFKYFENDRQRLLMIELTKERIREITAIMLDLDDQINIKLNIYGESNKNRK